MLRKPKSAATVWRKTQCFILLWWCFCSYLGYFWGNQWRPLHRGHCHWWRVHCQWNVSRYVLDYDHLITLITFVSSRIKLFAVNDVNDIRFWTIHASLQVPVFPRSHIARSSLVFKILQECRGASTVLQKVYVIDSWQRVYLKNYATLRQSYKWNIFPAHWHQIEVDFFENYFHE